MLLLHDPARGWDLPKGKPEPDERPLDTALRETREEAGVDVSLFRPLTWTWVPDIYVFWGMAFQPPALGRNPESGRYEHDAVGYFTLDQAYAIVMPALRPVIREAWLTLYALPKGPAE